MQQAPVATHRGRGGKPSSRSVFVPTGGSRERVPRERASPAAKNLAAASASPKKRGTRPLVEGVLRASDGKSGLGAGHPLHHFYYS
ncbi:hypothetical protein MRX96_038952 [Rhipicephalus microplus]